MKSFALGENKQLLVGAVQGLYEVDISNLSKMFERPDLPFKSKVLLSDLNVWSIVNEHGTIDLATDKGLFKFDLNTKLFKLIKLIHEDRSLLEQIKSKQGQYSDKSVYKNIDKEISKIINNEEY